MKAMKNTSMKAMCAACGLALMAAIVPAWAQPGSGSTPGAPGAAKPAAGQPGAATPPGTNPGGVPPIKSVTGGQPATPPPPPPPARTASVAKWTDADLEKAGQMIAGTWKTTKDVPLGDGSGSTALVMSIAPVAINGVENAMFSEIARADSVHAPFRTAIYQLYKHQGKIRLRTYELHRGQDGTDMAVKALAGMSFIPQWFPSDLNRDWLVGTLDLELTVDSNGIKGKTPYPYPTAVGGAVEMTSELTITKDSATTQDRGFDANGKVVWGDKEGAATWARSATPAATVRTLEEGLIVIEYSKGDGLKIDSTERIAANYTGWVGKNMKFVDSSRNKQPLVFNQGQMIRGWTNALKGYAKGANLRLFIPPAMAWGERGRSPMVPPNADVIFEVEVVNVEAAPVAQPAAPAGPDTKQPEAKQPEAKPAEAEKKADPK
jgi:FKBP-type peptidyl-prolyl cis-trans isomerase